METLNLIMQRIGTLYNEVNPKDNKDLRYEEMIDEMISKGKLKPNFRESIFYMLKHDNINSNPEYSCDCVVHSKLNSKCCKSIDDFVNCPQFKFYILYYPLCMIYHDLNVPYSIITADINEYYNDFFSYKKIPIFNNFESNFKKIISLILNYNSSIYEVSGSGLKTLNVLNLIQLILNYKCLYDHKKFKITFQKKCLEFHNIISEEVQKENPGSMIQYLKNLNLPNNVFMIIHDNL